MQSIALHLENRTFSWSITYYLLLGEGKVGCGTYPLRDIWGGLGALCVFVY